MLERILDYSQVVLLRTLARGLRRDLALPRAQKRTAVVMRPAAAMPEGRMAELGRMTVLMNNGDDWDPDNEAGVKKTKFGWGARDPQEVDKPTELTKNLVHSIDGDEGKPTEHTPPPDFTEHEPADSHKPTELTANPVVVVQETRPDRGMKAEEREKTSADPQPSVARVILDPELDRPIDQHEFDEAAAGDDKLTPLLRGPNLKEVVFDARFSVGTADDSEENKPTAFWGGPGGLQKLNLVHGKLVYSETRPNMDAIIFEVAKGVAHMRVAVRRMRHEIEGVGIYSVLAACAAAPTLLYLLPVTMLGLSAVAGGSLLVGAAAFLLGRAYYAQRERERFDNMYQHRDGREILAQGFAEWLVSNKMAARNFKLPSAYKPLETLVYGAMMLLVPREGLVLRDVSALIRKLQRDSINRASQTCQHLQGVEQALETKATRLATDGDKLT